MQYLLPGGGRTADRLCVKRKCKNISYATNKMPFERGRGRVQDEGCHTQEDQVAGEISRLQMVKRWLELHQKVVDGRPGEGKS